MRKVHQDPHAIQFLDELFPQLRQPVPLVDLVDRRPRTRGRRKGAMAGMRQGQVADTQLCEEPQRAQRVSEQVGAFHTDEGGDLAGAEGVPHLARRASVLQVVRVARDHVLDHVEHLHRVAQVVRWLVEIRPRILPYHVVARRPHRPERPA